MGAVNWYQSLVKPFWAPPAWIFGPVWIVLYGIIAVSFGAVFYRVFTKKLPRFVALPFLLNLIFNVAFSPLQFGLQNNLLAAIDVVLVLVTLIWALILIYRPMRWVFWANVPYLAWVTFATILQLTVTYLNW